MKLKHTITMIDIRVQLIKRQEEKLNGMKGIQREIKIK